MPRIKKICVVTGSRAEYGIFKPLLRALATDRRFELLLAVTGMHLLPRYGSTVRHIAQDGFKIAARIPMYRGNRQDDRHYAQAVARATDGLSRFLDTARPDALVVLGDRPEPLAAAIAAAFLKVPIIHLHGGERTESRDIDESIRHAITRFAALHLVATNEARARLVRFGEEPWRIHNVGALGIEILLREPVMSREKFCREFGLAAAEPFVVAMFHPIHLEPEHSGAEMKELLGAIRERNVASIVIFPNNDAGNQAIIEQIETVRHNPRFKIYQSLPHDRYANALRHAAAMVGNSSSGIIETPAFGLPFVNIGSRQVGRPQAGNVLQAPARRVAISRAIGQALRLKASGALRRLKNPYGSGGASKKIIGILAAADWTNPKWLAKKITF